MKKLIIGLVLGILVTGVIGFLSLPGIKKAEYDNGFEAGVKKGTADGTAAGITKGIAQVHEEQAQKHKQDSTAAAIRYINAKRKAAMRKPKEVVKPVQNWHVIDGKIDDPITN
jgi:hypothetical protein